VVVGGDVGSTVQHKTGMRGQRRGDDHDRLEQAAPLAPPSLSLQSLGLSAIHVSLPCCPAMYLCWPVLCCVCCALQTCWWQVEWTVSLAAPVGRVVDPYPGPHRLQRPLQLQPPLSLPRPQLRASLLLHWQPHLSATAATSAREQLQVLAASAGAGAGAGMAGVVLVGMAALRGCSTAQHSNQAAASGCA